MKTQSRLLSSGSRRECPVCCRTRDADCRMSPDLSLVICHHPRMDLVPWVDGEGSYLFVRNTRDDRAAVFVREDAIARRQL